MNCGTGEQLYKHCGTVVAEGLLQRQIHCSVARFEI
jgi:hypothetical protein